MTILLSPGVATQEIDLTTIIPTVSSTAGAFAGFFRWGPVNKPFLVDSEPTMAKTVQPPNSNTAAFYWTAANFLNYGNTMWLCRANSGGLYNATANGAPSIMIPNSDVYRTQYWAGSLGLYGPWFARYPSDLGNSLSVSICPSAQAYASNLTSTIGMTATATLGNNQIVLSAAAAANLVVGDLVQIGPTPTTNGFVQITAMNGTTITTALGSVSANVTGTFILRKWQYAKLFTGAPGTSAYVASKSGSNDQIHVVVVDANNAFNGSTTANYLLETYPYLSKASDTKNADSSPGYYKHVIFNKSNYILWADHMVGSTNWGNTAQGTSFDVPSLPLTTPLSGGSDITNPYSYTGSAIFESNNDAGLEIAWSYFNNQETYPISLLPLGPASLTIQQYVGALATNRADCVAFFSPRYSDVVNQTGNEATNIVNEYIPALNFASTYVVVDSGWKYQLDKYSQIYEYLPLNGDIAGLCARTDKLRAPWWSPAGYNRGQIQNLSKLAWNPSNVVGTAYRDLLYTNGVNPVVSFKGSGTILYGDKTFTVQPSAFDRINVRRLFIILEQSISLAAKYSLFEFNDNFTRAAFVNMVEPYLRTIQGQRGIYDFLVVCDTTNNTPQIIDADQFVGDIYIKPARSINYITLHFVAVGTGVAFNTIVGQF